MNFRSVFKSRHTIPLLILFVLCSVYWNRVLISSDVLLPDSLRGFAPFGADLKAPWNILQWDALGQYFPWRFFAAQQLHAGQIPLWNPHQFAGTPFLANGQSAIFYPLSAPFWFLDTARAFGVSAWMHSLLACVSTYFLVQHWKMSRAAALLAAIAFGFCGYLTFWVSLPTLSNTASWLPLLLLIFERIVARIELSNAPNRVLETANSTSRDIKNASAKLRATNSNSQTSAATSTPQNLSSTRQISTSRDTAISPQTASSENLGERNRVLEIADSSRKTSPTLDFCYLVLALACAYFAGHPQIFFYCVLALFLRALTFPLRVWQGTFRVLILALFATISLCAIQILPTLELARLGHRAGQSASQGGWDFVVGNALRSADLGSLIQPFYAISSFDENKGYIGAGVFLLSLAAIFLTIWTRLSAKSSTRNARNNVRNAKKSGEESMNFVVKNDENPRGFAFALLLTFFGIAFALATPLAKIFYFGVPGLSQMGGVGRALCFWSLGAALLAAFGLDALRARFKSPILPLLALLIVSGELFAASYGTQPTAPRAAIYPETTLTKFLQNATKSGGRILFYTPRQRWFASEDLPPNVTISHPPGILPPNGATVYGLDDVNGYDSLSSKAYRQFLGDNEGADISPPRNGNIVFLNNLNSPALTRLDVRYVVVPENITVPNAREVLRAENCVVFQRNRVLDSRQQKLERSGRDFFPGWKNGVYNPESFRLGAFLSLLMLGALSFLFGAQIASFTGRNPLKHKRNGD